jgi:hypothetical protein
MIRNVMTGKSQETFDRIERVRKRKAEEAARGEEVHYPQLSPEWWDEELARQDQADMAWRRFAWENLPALLQFPAAPVVGGAQAALRASAPLYQRVIQGAYWPARAAISGMTQYLGTTMGNLADPTTYTPPASTAYPAAALEFIFGRLPWGIQRLVAPGLATTREGQIVTETLKKVDPTLAQTPGMHTPGSHMAETERLMQRLPLQGALRTAYRAAQESIDQVLKGIRLAMGAGTRSENAAWQLVRNELGQWQMVPTGGQSGLEADALTSQALQHLGLHAPGGRTIPEIRRLTGEVEAANRATYPQWARDNLARYQQQRASQGQAALTPPEEARWLEDHLLAEVPTRLQAGVHQALDAANQRLDQIYTVLDGQVWRTPLDPKDHTTLGTLRTLTMPDPSQVAEGSAFHTASDALALAKGIAGQEETTLAGVYDLARVLYEARDDVARAIMEKTTRDPLSGETRLTSEGAKDLRDRIMPRLNEAIRPVDALLKGKMVDISAIKAQAAAKIDEWERGTRTTRLTTREGVPAPNPAMAEDPDIAWFRGLQRLPDAIPFGQAQRIRSEAGYLKRQEGLSIGNVVARHGDEYSDHLKRAMTDTAVRLGNTGLYDEWRAADTAYHNLASVWNSPLMMDVVSMSPDDYLTRLVRNERPGDMATLRQAVPQDIWEQVGPLWLTRQIERARDPVTGALSAEALEGTLNTLTRATEAQVFGQIDTAPLHQRLDQAVAMQRALTAEDGTALGEYMGRIGDPALQQVVQADKLAPLFAQSTEAATDLTQPGQLKSRLDAKGQAWRDALFPRGELDTLRDQLGQADALVTASRTADSAELYRMMQRLTPAQQGLVQQDWYTREIAPLLGTAGDVNMDALYRVMHDLRTNPTRRLALFPGGEIDQFLPAMEKANALHKAPTATDPQMLTAYKSTINDPVVWQEQVASDWLFPALQIDQKTGLIDAKAILTHLDNNPVVTRLMLGADGERELRHFALTADVLANQTSAALHPAWAQGAFGGLVVGGTYLSGSVGGGLATGVGVATTMHYLSRLLTAPRITRWLTSGMHVAPGAQQAIEAFGHLLGTRYGSMSNRPQDVGETPPAP